MVDPARIGLAPLQCECSVLPLNYGPSFGNSIGAPRIELGSRAPEARIIPLYDAPIELPKLSSAPYGIRTYDLTRVKGAL